MGFSLKDWRGVRRQSRGLVYMASPYLAGALPTAFLGWLGKKSVTTGRWDWRGADRDVVWKSQLLQPGYQKAFLLSVTRGRATERRVSVHCTHTDQTGSYLGPLKPRRGRRSVWGELLKLICSEVKLCEWFVLHNLWSVTCQPQMDSSRTSLWVFKE